MFKQLLQKGYAMALAVGLLLTTSVIHASCSDEQETAAAGEWLAISTDLQEFTFEGGTKELEYTLGDGYDEDGLQLSLTMEGDKWLTATAQNGKLTLVCEHSYTENARNTTLKIVYDNAHQKSISIVQEKAPSTEDQLIQVTGGSADSENVTGGNDNHPFTMSYDGDEQTFFNSKYGAVTYPFHFTYELESGHSLHKIVYTPRQEYNYWGYLNEFSVEVSTADAPDDFIQIGEYKTGNDSYSTTPFSITLPEDIINARKVRFTVTKGYQDRISVAEMEFYEASRNKFDISSIFADEMGTMLQDGITKKQIEQIPNKYLKETALQLLEGTYDTQYRLAEYRPYQDPSVMARANKTNKYSLRDNPTGIYTKQYEKIPVFVGPVPAGRRISILIQDVSKGYNNFRQYELTEGYNEVEAGVGGLIYVLNHVDDDIPLPAFEANATQRQIIADNTVKIHFAGGKVNGYFDIGRNTEAEWKDILSRAEYQDIDVLGNYAHLTWKVEDFRKYNTPITESIRNLDNLVYAEWEFIGLVKYDRYFNNRMHCCIDYQAASPNATDYRTVYSDGGYDNLFTDISVWKNRFWGPAHEVGHCNQTRPGLKWTGLVEVTNNLTALYVEETLGITSRVLTKGWYENGINLIVKPNLNNDPTDDMPHCVGYSSSLYNKVEEKLVPFWQLKRYFVDALGMTDFYHDLYEYFRTHESPSDRGENQGANQLDFVRQVCAISGYNLLDFFKAWGFLCPVDTKLNDNGTTRQFTITQEQVDALVQEIESKHYKKPHAELWEITDENFQDFAQ